MFVATGARELLLTRRREEFRKQYMAPLLQEARVLNIDAAELHLMIDHTEGDPT
jgi:GntR family transcriptional regulator